MPRSNDKNLSQARVLYKSKKFSQVISILSPQIFLFRTNPEFYTILGISCLYTNDFGGAHSYLSRAVDLDKNNVNARLGLAVIALRRGNLTDALQFWLDVVAVQSENRQAKHGLELIKNAEGEEDSFRDLDARMRKLLYPSPGFTIRPALPWIAAVIAAAGVILGAYFGIQALTREPVLTREGAELLSFAPDLPRLSAAGAFELIFTSAQLNQLLRDASLYFEQGEDNRVRHIMRRILLSNASLDIKAQIQLLEGSLRVPDFVNDFWSPAYQDVSSSPSEYETVYIKWTGKVSNLRTLSSAIVFDFLVGFETEQELLGIVQTRVPFAIQLSSGDNVELIGKLQRNGANLGVEASALRRIR